MTLLYALNITSIIVRNDAPYSSPSTPPRETKMSIIILKHPHLEKVSVFTDKIQ